MNATAISWTDFTANLVRYRDADGKDVWACAKTSTGCQHCYSEALARRYGKGGPFTEAEVRKVTPYFAEGEAKKLLTAKKLAGKRCFIGDMTDVFGAWVPDELLDRMFAVFALRPDVVFQLLTKRPERMAAYLPADAHLRMTRCMVNFREYTEPVGPWPLPNVWLGVSVENQAAADERIPHLLRAPAAVRFLSVEPLLGPVNLGRSWRIAIDAGAREVNGWHPGIHWIIVGGESGPRHRPMELAWLESVVRQCRAAGVPCHVKQDAGPRPGMQGRIPDDIWSVKEFPK